MVNKWAINSSPLNYGTAQRTFGGTGRRRANWWTINQSPINGVHTVAAGSGSVISFSQEVEYRQTGQGSLVDVYQSVRASGSGNLISISQLVRSPAQTTFLSRNGWYPILIINGLTIPDNQIHDIISLSRIENDAAQLSFTIIPPVGTIDITSYEGKFVQLFIATSSTQAILQFSGYINIPELDIINRRLKFNCTDNRRERINSQMSGQVPYLGYYTQDVFGVPEDTADELEKRLTTIPYAVDIATNGTCQTTPLLAKASANHTLVDIDVYREDGRDPQVTYSTRSRIVNQVIVNAEYRFQRAYHRQIQYNWRASYADNVCDFLGNGYSVATREMVQGAAQSAGWPLRGPITFIPVLAAGFYNCYGFTIAWATGHYTGSVAPVTESILNSDGTTTIRTKKDANGNDITQIAPTSYVDTGSSLCFGASWLATTRWTQNITEQYTFSISASQSVAQYGTITQQDSIGVQSEFDSGAWEDYKAYRGVPTGWATVPANTSAGSYYINFDTNITSWYQAAQIGINKAYTTIVRAHRENRVKFWKFLWPEVDLSHTVALNCTKLQAKGKVYSINHVMNVGTGEAYTQVELAVSRAPGSASTDAFSLPARPSYSIPAVEPIINLQSHYGQDPTNHPEWNGHIGNKYVTALTESGSYNTKKTNYPHSFIVDNPSIEPAARDNITLLANKTFNVGIQNDTLNVILTEH